MINLQGKRPKIRPLEFSGLIPEPNANLFNGQWLMCRKYLYVIYLYLCIFGSEINIIIIRPVSFVPINKDTDIK